MHERDGHDRGHRRAPGRSHGHSHHELLSPRQQGENLGVSVMLIGSVLFHTSLFYLVNHPDKEMKRHAWFIISSTISIFAAVLVFEGNSSVIRAVVDCVDSS